MMASLEFAKTHVEKGMPKQGKAGGNTCTIITIPFS